MRGADPAIVLVPGVGMFSFGADAADGADRRRVLRQRDQRDARRRGAVDATRPIDEAEKFRIEYWALEEAKLRRLPGAQAAGRPRRARDRSAASGHRPGDRACGWPPRARRWSSPTSIGAPRRWRTSSAAPTRDGVEVDVTDEAAVDAALAAACRRYGGVDIVVNNAGLSISKPLLETTAADWDLQHDVMARGSFLVSREAARVMVAQGRGGDIVYIVSKNAVVAGPNNIAYGAAKADQAHQVRLLAAELGAARHPGQRREPRRRRARVGHLRRRLGRGAGQGLRRAPEEDLGEFYAGRTLLRHGGPARARRRRGVRAASVATSPLTTGMIVPVDGGVPQAFLR